MESERGEGLPERGGEDKEGRLLVRVEEQEEKKCVTAQLPMLLYRFTDSCSII